jgi:hypothetical protein
MKKLIILSILAVSASLAHAGAGCGDCTGDKKKDKAGKADSSKLPSSLQKLR